MKKLSQAAFAQHHGVDRSYITQLKQAGRLVMTADGKVDVEASELRIKETEDPNRDDVRARHAKNRQPEVAAKPESVKAEKPAKAKEPKSDDEISFQRGRAKEQHFKALQAELLYQKTMGTLVEISSVQKGAAEIGKQLRTLLENLPDQLAPELAAVTGVERVNAILVERCEQILNELASKVQQTVQTMREQA